MVFKTLIRNFMEHLYWKPALRDTKADRASMKGFEVCILQWLRVRQFDASTHLLKLSRSRELISNYLMTKEF